MEILSGFALEDVIPGFEEGTVQCNAKRSFLVCKDVQPCSNDFLAAVDVELLPFKYS
jgi:hypothetical protein